MSEFHDLSEIALNREGEAWGNLGYWRDARDYSSACRALAMRLGQAAQLDGNSVVMDAGFGCGDQIALWREHYQVGQIFGVNQSRSQTDYARRTLPKKGYDLNVGALRTGDIDDDKQWQFSAADQPVNRVLALDCVYHFPSRQRFLGKAFHRLQPGGRIAVTDFVLAGGRKDSPWKQLILRTMLKLSHIPVANMESEEDYISGLQKTGFEQVAMEDISAPVMAGFSDWVRGSGDRRSTLSWQSRLKYAATAKFLDWAYRRRILRYYLISAVKPAS